MLAGKDHLVELAQNRVLLVHQGLVDHVGQIGFVLERHAANPNIGKEVVLTRLSVAVVAVIVPCAVET